MWSPKRMIREGVTNKKERRVWEGQNETQIKGRGKNPSKQHPPSTSKQPSFEYKCTVVQGCWLMTRALARASLVVLTNTQQHNTTNASSRSWLREGWLGKFLYISLSCTKENASNTFRVGFWVLFLLFIARDSPILRHCGLYIPYFVSLLICFVSTYFFLLHSEKAMGWGRGYFTYEKADSSNWFVINIRTKAKESEIKTKTNIWKGKEWTI